MNVFIVEDSAIIRGRIIALLNNIKGVEIAGYADDPDEAVRYIARTEPDVVILDIRLQGGSGIDVLERIRELSAKTKIIMLTNFPEPHYRKKCSDLGADYFFDKSNDFDKIVQVLTKSA